jgi:ABC-type multidrug transport system permease subunit
MTDPTTRAPVEPGAVRRFLSNVMAVAYKEGVTLRHDQAFIGAVLIQPIMMLLLYGFALSNKPAHVPWVVLDQNRTAASRGFLEAVQSTGYFLPPRPVDSYEAGQTLLRRGTAVAFVIVPIDFRRAVERGRPQVQVLLDGTDPITAARVGGIISQVGAAYQVRSDTTPPPPPVDLQQRFRFNPTLRDREFFLAALAGMLLTNVCLSVTSLGIVGERESGTYEHMLSQPTTAVEIVFGKLAPHLVIGYAVLLLAVVLSGLAFGIWPRGSWIALFMVTLPFVLSSLAIGVFVSTLASTSAQAVFISVFFILPSFVLSGSMFPYQLMPPGVREVGFILPLRWYQIALRRVIERGAGVADVMMPLLALFGLFAGLMLLIRWRMKPRLA